MNAVVQIRPRTLANVLLEITAAKRENEHCYKRSIAAWKAGDHAEDERQGDLGAAIDQRIMDLTEEAKAMIHDATGVTWEQMYEVLA